MTRRLPARFKFGILIVGVASLVTVISVLAVTVVAQTGPSEPDPVPNPASSPSIPKVDEKPPPTSAAPGQPICGTDPALCQYAQDILAQSRSGTAAHALSTRVAMKNIPCPMTDTPPHLLPLCSDSPGRPQDGFTISSFGKPAQLVGDQEFTHWVSAALSTPVDRKIELVSVGCSQPDRKSPPVCSLGAAVAFRLTDSRGDESTVVLLFGRDSAAANGFGLFGAYFGVSGETFVTGGLYRFAGLFPQGQVGADYYFEPVSS